MKHMKNIVQHILLALVWLMPTISTAQVWPQMTMGAVSSGGGGGDVAQAIAYDAAGNIYMAGYFNGDINADRTGATTTYMLSSAGSADIYIGKYSPSGGLIWAFSIGGTGDDVVSSLAVDGSGNLYVGGTLTLTSSMNVDADPSSNTNNVTGPTAFSSSDMFLAKYDATLLPSNTSFYKWGFVMGSSSTENITSMALDGNNLYVGGNTFGAFDANPSSNTATISTAGNGDMFIAKYDISQVPSNTSFYQWAFRQGSGATEDLTEIVVKDGYIYICSAIEGNATLDADPSGNTANITGAGGNTGLDIFMAKYDAAFAPSSASFYKWAFAIGSINGDRPYALTVDATGNVYVGGYMTGSTATNLDADPSTNVNNITGATATSSVDWFLAKYDGTQTPSGASFYKWAFTTSSTTSNQFEYITGLGVDASGSLYVSGYLWTSTSIIDMDPSTNVNGVISPTGTTSTSIVAVKYDPALLPSDPSFYKWSFAISPGGNGVTPTNMIVGNNMMYIVGSGFATLDTDPSSNTNSLFLTRQVVGFASMVAVAYDLNFAPTSTSFHKAGIAVGEDPLVVGSSGSRLQTAIDAVGNTYVCGQLNGAMRLGAGGSSVALSSPGDNNDVFVAKYNTAGTLLWAFRVGGSGDDIPYDMVVDEDGYIYIAGSASLSTTVSIDMDPSSNTNNISRSTGSINADAFVAKYDGNLLPSNTSFYQWAFSMGSAAQENIQALAVDDDGYVYVSGIYQTVFDADPSANNNTLPAPTNFDIMVAKYDGNQLPSGTSFYQWAFRLSGPSGEGITDITLDSSGNLYLLGNTAMTNIQTMDADPSANTNTISGVATPASSDILVAKYDATLQPTNTAFYKWAFVTGGTALDNGTGIAVDDNGSVYVLGYINGNTSYMVDADPSGNVNNVSGRTASASNDILLAKYDGTLMPSNTSFYKWAATMGNTGNDQMNVIKVDTLRNIYLYGTSYITTSLNIDMDPSTNVNNAIGLSTAFSDAVLVKYNGNLTPADVGFFTWVYVMGGTSSDFGMALACKNDRVSIGGFFLGTNRDFQPGGAIQNLSSVNSGANASLFVASYLDNQTFKWTGATSTNWATATNWKDGVVPTASDNATIPGSDVLHEPTINANASVLGLEIEGGRTLTLSSGNLEINGIFHNAGSTAGTGRVVLSGSAAQEISGSGTTHNLELDNTAGASIFATAQLNLTGRYTPTLGTLTTNARLVLKSTATATASIGQGSGSYLSGTTTVERYIQGGRRAFRFLGHPFTATMALSQLQDDIDITGSGGATNGFVTTGTNSPSAFLYNPVAGNENSSNDPGWQALTSATTANWPRARGARVLIRGAKDEGLWGGTYTPSAVTLDMIGTLNTGNQFISLTKGTNSGYNVIGNPYACPLRPGPALAAASNINGSLYWVWDPMQQGNNGKGAYVPYVINALATDAIPSFSAISVLVSATTSVTFAEAHKATTSNVNAFRTTAIADMAELHIMDTAGNYYDRIYVRNDAAAADAMEQTDGRKANNPNVNFYAWSADSKKLSLDTRPFVHNDVIPLGFTTNEKKRYVLEVRSAALAAGTGLTLHDKYLNSFTPMDMGARYEFDITSDTLSQGDNRFELGVVVMTPPPVTGVKEIVKSKLEVNCTPNPASDYVNIGIMSSEVANTIVSIYSLNGSMVYRNVAGELKDRVMCISLNKLVAGMYIISVQHGKDVVTGRVVKQ